MPKRRGKARLDPDTALKPSRFFAHRMREARESQGLLQQDLVDILNERTGGGWHKPKISQIENAKRAVSLDEAIAIAMALGVSLIHLLLPPNNIPKIELIGRETFNVIAARQWFRGFGFGPLENRVEEDRRLIQEMPINESKVLREQPEIYAQLNAALLYLSLAGEEEPVAEIFKKVRARLSQSGTTEEQTDEGKA